VCTLVGDETREDGYHQCGIEHTLSTIYQHGCQQEVVDDEDDEIDGKEFPYQ
jgi:hypothetical protein